MKGTGPQDGERGEGETRLRSEVSLDAAMVVQTSAIHALLLTRSLSHKGLRAGGGRKWEGGKKGAGSAGKGALISLVVATRHAN